METLEGIPKLRNIVGRSWPERLTDRDEIKFARERGLMCPYLSPLRKHLTIPEDLPEPPFPVFFGSPSAQRGYNAEELRAMWEWKQQQLRRAQGPTEELNR